MKGSIKNIWLFLYVWLQDCYCGVCKCCLLLKYGNWPLNGKVSLQSTFVVRNTQCFSFGIECQMRAKAVFAFNLHQCVFSPQRGTCAQELWSSAPGASRSAQYSQQRGRPEQCHSLDALWLPVGRTLPWLAGGTSGYHILLDWFIPDILIWGRNYKLRRTPNYSKLCLE